MIRPLLTMLAFLAPGLALACPEPSKVILFHSCWGEAQASSLLLPEDGPVPQAGVERLVVTGGYTGKDRRQDALPNPVGMFIHKGEVINPNLARMDGIAVLTTDGRLSIQHRDRLRFQGHRYDLGNLDERKAFQKAAVASGASVFQSHLLIVDETLDIRPREDAPLAVRRLLFTDNHGFGIYQTDGRRSLHDSALDVSTAVVPDMALNLDMGSFDYCLLTREGVEQNCGVLGRENTQKLSNLLVFSLKPRS